MPWAGRLWYLTYPQHKTTGSTDKLYELDEEMNVTIRPESVGGTHASRAIHAESQQLILGPYFIDAQRNVRSANLQQLRGRMTAVMRHLQDPANRVYFFDMEGAIYEVDVHSLEVKKLFDKPVPGWHGKGGYTAQGRVVVANNGEVGNAAAYKTLLVGGPAQGEEAGVLAEWDGRRWAIVERRQFTDVTGPGGIHGSPQEQSPLWAIGWDKRSVILKLLAGGQWYSFRLPKATHTMDPRHGWFTEWPRIREIAPNQPMLCTHGGMFRFPPTFSAGKTAGIRPLCSHLRYIPDYCEWNGRVVLGADDASMMNNPLCGQAQSNLWFGQLEELDSFGPRAGWGGVWLQDEVRSREPSVPFLIAGYEQRVVHLAQDAPQAVEFTLELDVQGNGHWTPYATITVPAGGYGHHILPSDVAGEWLRITANRDCRATAYFHGWSPRPVSAGEADRFAALADVTAAADYSGGLLRPAGHNRTLQWLAEPVAADGARSPARYLEVDLRDNQLQYQQPEDCREHEVRTIASVREDFSVDKASVLVRDAQGMRYRLPKGAAAFDRPFPTGWPRAVRECVSERFLANIHGTFYEIPRDGKNAPHWGLIKPVCSHEKVITDFCTWRGLLVLCGARRNARSDGQVFGQADGMGLWFGTIDDLWRLGEPTGRGGPWQDTAIRAGEASDPYLMTGYDRKRLELRHTAESRVEFVLEVDFDHTGFHPYARLEVPAGKQQEYAFPAGFHAHWVRLIADRDCSATATFSYE